MTTLEELRRIPLFDGLTDEELRGVAGEGSEKFVPAGEVNGREGEPVEHLYVILEGQLRITKRADGGEVVINTYTPGAFFAEVPLLAGTPFLATGRALTDCRLFLIPNDVFRRMLAAYPSFSDAILETMAQRVQILQSVVGQRERLNSLGTLAAGLAHELNNPASASRRAAGRLREVFENLRSLGMGLSRAAARGEVGPAQLDELARISGVFVGRDGTSTPASAPTLGALEQSDLEEELALWLEDRGVEDAWKLAPTFVGAGLGAADLEAVVGAVPPELLPDALRYLEAAFSVSGLVDEVEGSATRISELVGTMEGYSFMDRAPVQEVDIHRGIEDTLSVLGHKLRGVEIERAYDRDLPRVTAYGSELNQVWTALVDNAIDAAGEAEGPGRIRLRTACENDRVLVEISDNGPGVPEELQARVFEPYFTTKGVGAGVGLGLDVSYRIVVGRHGGDIRVVSRPGETRFEVRLPVDAASDEAEPAAAAADGTGGGP